VILFLISPTRYLVMADAIATEGNPRSRRRLSRLGSSMNVRARTPTLRVNGFWREAGRTRVDCGKLTRDR
jgi:hypothetical protein